MYLLYQIFSMPMISLYLSVLLLNLKLTPRVKNFSIIIECELILFEFVQMKQMKKEYFSSNSCNLICISYKFAKLNFVSKT